MAKNISNSNSNTLLSGTDDNDKIYNGSYNTNGGNYVTIKAKSGNEGSWIDIIPSFLFFKKEKEKERT